jgi:hypothetical protein
MKDSSYTDKLLDAVFCNRVVSALVHVGECRPFIGVLMLVVCSVSLVFGANRAVAGYATSTARAEARRVLAKGETVTLRDARIYWFQARIAVLTDKCDVVSIPTQNPFFGTLLESFISTGPSYHRFPLKVKLTYVDEPIQTDKGSYPAVGQSGSHLNFELLEDGWGKPPDPHPLGACAWPDNDG